MSAVTKTKPRAGGLRASVNVGTGQSSNEANDSAAHGPRLCPRWERCSAPVCPLDAEWRQRSHVRGEAVCGLLLELAKADGEATLRGCLPAELVETGVAVAPGMLHRWGPLRRASEKASKSGSKLRQSARLRGEVAND